jgi:hypothetical protein
MAWVSLVTLSVTFTTLIWLKMLLLVPAHFLQAMFDTLDVSKAQATVEADRKRILAEIDVSGW